MPTLTPLNDAAYNNLVSTAFHEIVRSSALEVLIHSGDSPVDQQPYVDGFNLYLRSTLDRDHKIILTDSDSLDTVNINERTYRAFVHAAPANADETVVDEFTKEIAKNPEFASGILLALKRSGRPYNEEAWKKWVNALIDKDPKYAALFQQEQYSAYSIVVNKEDKATARMLPEEERVFKGALDAYKSDRQAVSTSEGTPIAMSENGRIKVYITKDTEYQSAEAVKSFKAGLQGVIRPMKYTSVNDKNEMHTYLVIPQSFMNKAVELSEEKSDPKHPQSSATDIPDAVKQIAQSAVNISLPHGGSDNVGSGVNVGMAQLGRGVEV